MVGQPNNAYEQEADQVARDVTQQEAQPAVRASPERRLPGRAGSSGEKRPKGPPAAAEELEKEKEAVQTKRVPERLWAKRMSNRICYKQSKRQGMCFASRQTKKRTARRSCR